MRPIKPVAINTRIEGSGTTASTLNAKSKAGTWDTQTFGDSSTHIGIDDPDAVWYLPTSYPGFFAAMRHVPVSGAFVDYGSGIGRILVAAATFPFVRVTGMELSDTLVRRSLENVARCRGTLCKKSK